MPIVKMGQQRGQFSGAFSKGRTEDKLIVMRENARRMDLMIAEARRLFGADANLHEMTRHRDAMLRLCRIYEKKLLYKQLDLFD